MWSINKRLGGLCLSVVMLLGGCSADTASDPAAPPSTATSTATATTAATTDLTTETTVVTSTTVDIEVTTVTTDLSAETAATAPSFEDNRDVFLLIGSDARAGDSSSRSDTLMLIATDHDTRTVKVVSLLRDTWVTIPGLDNNGDGIDDTNKLNTAYFFGGFSMLTQTVFHNFGIAVDACIAVDFEAFEKAVDILDGIELELTADEIGWINDHCDPDISGGAGVYHLNGKQVVAFSRARTLYADSDFSRQANQRRVLRTLVSKAASVDAVTMLNTARAMLPFIDSDIGDLALLGKLTALLGAADYAFESHYSVPAPGEFENTWIEGGLGLRLTDQAETADNLKNYIYG